MKPEAAEESEERSKRRQASGMKVERKVRAAPVPVRGLAVLVGVSLSLSSGSWCRDDDLNSFLTRGGNIVNNFR